MAGRAAKVEAQAPAEPIEPETEASAPIVAEANPFGKPQTLDHGKVDGGKGIPMADMQSKPMEAGYVEPEMRSNPVYLAKLAAEKADREAADASRKKAMKAFGIGLVGEVVGASPNSPIANVKNFY